ncbi:MAG TPA: hypothetical protein VF988_08790 [Verrucomicrobiae bacterium]
MQEQIPLFAKEPWYRNHMDHRCPHDAWVVIPIDVPISLKKD